MNKKNKANQTAQLALLIATMVVIEVLSQTIFAAFVLPIKPTLTHIPVIIASIVYGPKIGAYLGGFMGIMSIIRNTIIYSVSSYLFSPFVEGGTWASAVIAIVPRILIGTIFAPILLIRTILELVGILTEFGELFCVHHRITHQPAVFGAVDHDQRAGLRLRQAGEFERILWG